MKSELKLWLIFILSCLAVGSVCLLKPIPQDPSYHHFADQRSLWGIPNFLNVITNWPFVLIGISGLFLLPKASTAESLNWIYGVMFMGILLTGFGSAYYHWSPDNNTLVFDRIPMTLVFMSLLTATISELVSRKWANLIFIPLLLLGVGSVCWWHHTELAGQGDLRLYGLVQFYPVLLIPLLIGLYAAPKHQQAFRPLVWVVGWYLIAKVLEQYDGWIYDHTGFISGHSLKHLAAAVATGFIVKLFANRYIPPGLSG